MQLVTLPAAVYVSFWFFFPLHLDAFNGQCIDFWCVLPSGKSMCADIGFRTVIETEYGILCVWDRIFQSKNGSFSVIKVKYNGNYYRKWCCNSLCRSNLMKITVDKNHSLMVLMEWNCSLMAKYKDEECVIMANIIAIQHQNINKRISHDKIFNNVVNKRYDRIISYHITCVRCNNGMKVALKPVGQYGYTQWRKTKKRNNNSDASHN